MPSSDFVSSLAALLVYLCIALIILCLISPLVFSFGRMNRELRRFFHVPRSALQFRLRTLLLGFAVIQVLLGIATSRPDWGVSGVFFCAAVLSFSGWCIWS